MALEDIIKKIQQEKENQKREIEKEYAQKIEAIKKKYQEEIEKKTEELLKKALEEKEQKILQAKVQLSAETKNLVLAKKQKILDELYQEVLEYLGKLNETDYLKIISKFLEKCPEEGNILVPPHLKNITQKAISEKGKNLPVIETNINSKGGFIFQTTNFEIDFTFERLVKNLRENTELKVSKILFNNI